MDEIEIKEEWTQEEFLRAKRSFGKKGIEVVLVDTILNPIQKANSVVYNPYELEKYPEGSIFVFYCDSGKDTLARLPEYKKRFPKHHCVSLRGGRGYWRVNMQLLDDEK